MKELILKDFRLLKFINIITAIFCLIGGYIGVSLDNLVETKLVYIFAVLISTYLASMMLGQKEIKTNASVVINSLPINRSLIVKSKYLFNIIYALVLSGIVWFSSNVLGSIFSANTPGVPMNIFDILLILSLSLLFYSFYLVLYYFNVGRAQLFNQIFYAMLILMPATLNRLDIDIANIALLKSLSEFGLSNIMYLLVLIGLIFYIISLSISIKIYKTKEI